jgi:hypothetical protein
MTQPKRDNVHRYSGINTSGKPREELLKIFVEVLREMRREGIVHFKSRKTATYIVAE